MSSPRRGMSSRRDLRSQRGRAESVSNHLSAVADSEGGGGGGGNAKATRRSRSRREERWGSGRCGGVWGRVHGLRSATPSGLVTANWPSANAEPRRDAPHTPTDVSPRVALDTNGATRSAPQCMARRPHPEAWARAAPSRPPSLSVVAKTTIVGASCPPTEATGGAASTRPRSSRSRVTSRARSYTRTARSESGSAGSTGSAKRRGARPLGETRAER